MTRCSFVILSSQQFTLWVRTLWKTRTPTLTLTIFRAFRCRSVFVCFTFFFIHRARTRKCRPGRSHRGGGEERIFVCLFLHLQNKREKHKRYGMITNVGIEIWCFQEENQSRNQFCFFKYVHRVQVISSAHTVNEQRISKIKKLQNKRELKKKEPLLWWN